MILIQSICMSRLLSLKIVCFDCYVDHRYLHVLTHSFPTLLSSYPHVRRHPVGLRLDADGIPRNAALGIARRAGCDRAPPRRVRAGRSEEHTSELQSLMRI